MVSLSVFFPFHSDVFHRGLAKLRSKTSQDSFYTLDLLLHPGSFQPSAEGLKRLRDMRLFNELTQKNGPRPGNISLSCHCSSFVFVVSCETRPKKSFNLTLIAFTQKSPTKIITSPKAYHISFISTLKFKTSSFQSLNFAHMREHFSTTNCTKQQHSVCKGVVLGNLGTCPSRKECMTMRHQKPDLCLQKVSGRQSAFLRALLDHLIHYMMSFAKRGCQSLPGIATCLVKGD